MIHNPPTRLPARYHRHPTRSDIPPVASVVNTHARPATTTTLTTKTTAAALPAYPAPIAKRCFIIHTQFAVTRQTAWEVINTVPHTHTRAVFCALARATASTMRHARLQCDMLHTLCRNNRVPTWGSRQKKPCTYHNPLISFSTCSVAGRKCQRMCNIEQTGSMRISAGTPARIYMRWRDWRDLCV